jgi:Outer membrane protein beta-barrel domain
MKVLALLILSFCLIGTSHGQRIISNKFNVQVSYSANSPLGKEVTVHDQYKSPSLLKNFQTGFSLGLGMSYMLNRVFFVRLEVSRSDFNNWDYTQTNRFDEARYSLVAIHPEIEIQSPFKNTGMLNRFSFFFRMGPSVSFHSVKLERSVYSSAFSTDFDFNNSSFSSPGITSAAGTNVSLNNTTVIGLSYGVSNYWVSSALFDDRTVTFTSLTVHAGFRFGNNKRYKYVD